MAALLPAGAYVATHWAVLLQWVHFWSLLLLASAPLVFVCSLKGARRQPRRGVWVAWAMSVILSVAQHPAARLAPFHPHPASPRPAPPLPRADGLWWLGSGRAVNALRRLLLLVSLGVFLLAVEERVIFHSFNQVLA